MSKYFQHFPYILYNDEVVTDITRRSSVLKKLEGNPYLFLPYTIKEGDTIETIADDYYGDPGLSWLIVMANNIIDPIADFFKDYQTFNEFVIQKYSKDAEKSLDRALKKYEILEWTQDTTRTDNIIYYRSVYNKDVLLSKETFLNNDTTKNFYTDFQPLRFFQYETEENDKLRTIQLISSQYTGQVIQEMRTILNA
tara:strand:- start:1378 stop:1965 length:588 start_codon:yes stop_codon:yes gene_type:complete